jgi:hypothetical protein
LQQQEQTRVTSAVTSCIKDATTRVDLGPIRFVVTTTATSDIKIVATRAKNDTSSNNYIVVNRNTRRTTIDFVYNKESNISSI